MSALRSEMFSQVIPSGLSWVVIRLWSMEFEGLFFRFLDFDSLSFLDRGILLRVWSKKSD